MIPWPGLRSPTLPTPAPPAGLNDVLLAAAAFAVLAAIAQPPTPDSLGEALPVAPLAPAAADQLLAVRAELRVDGRAVKRRRTLRAGRGVLASRRGDRLHRARRQFGGVAVSAYYKNAARC